jgi:hypothetical protein
MTGLNDRRCHVAFSPQSWARSPYWAYRVARLVILLAVLLGQIGWPDLSACCGGLSAGENSNGATAAGCRCSTTLKRRGRCCCAAPKSAVKSCCAQRKSSSAAVATCSPDAKATPSKAVASSEPLSFRDGCGCGPGEEQHGYRCTDPRLIPASCQLNAGAVHRSAVAILDDADFGASSPPPLPPPKSLPG